MAFDERIHCVDEKKRTEEAKLFIKHSSKTLIYAGKLFYSVLWKFYPTKDWKLFLESMDFIYGLIYILNKLWSQNFHILFIYLKVLEENM